VPGEAPIVQQYSACILASCVALSYVSLPLSRLHTPDYEFLGGGSRKCAYTKDIVVVFKGR